MTDAETLPIIVCATDLSASSRCALDFAIDLASTSGPARVHVLYVRESVERIESVAEVSERFEERQRELHDLIEHETAHVRAARGHLSEVEISTVVRFGKAYKEIVRYALEVGAETVVVGTHGRTGLGHAVIGSVAERVVHHAPCNVVVAKCEEVRAHLAEVIRRH